MTASAESFLHSPSLPLRDASRQAITAAWLVDESDSVQRVLQLATLPPERAQAVVSEAAGWVRRVRQLKDEQSPLDAFMRQYDLSSEEGVLLMCLAEALLRIPDDATAEKLIADKLSEADWEQHLGRSDSLFVNASTWGLMLTGRLVRVSPEISGNFKGALNRLLGRSTEPVIRLAIRQAMRLMGHQFVMGRTINEALKNARGKQLSRYRHSFDMLGEAALTAEDAQRYLAAYHHAIQAIGTQADPARDDPAWVRPSISVKLSALHPRYEPAFLSRVMDQLPAALLGLAQAAKHHNIGLTVDAEEADRLELSLDVFETVYRDSSLNGWEGLGLAVQAFQKRALPVIEWLEPLASSVGRRIPVRLVKGAYWDTEVKRAQEQGLAGYPVYTRKSNTDVAYLACARRLLTGRDRFYPMLATHNAHTVAAVRAFAGDAPSSAPGSDAGGYEFQRLHGMGEALYRVVAEDVPAPCRVYAPVGSHEDLLPYLVRRLLENGANTSFVNRIYDEQMPAEQLVADPVAYVASLSVKPNPDLPMPAQLYGALRRNSSGINFYDEHATRALSLKLAQAATLRSAESLLAGESVNREPREVRDPADRRRIVGSWRPLATASCAGAVEHAANAYRVWSQTPVETRADVLERAAERLDAEPASFLYLLVREAGKTLPDAMSEVRETVDFLRYYAAQARQLMARAVELPGPTGEVNTLALHGRGVFVCISPWNFPLAIFGGQVAAALVAGNTVIAKPAEQTPLIATQLVRLLHEAGIPRAVLQCALGEGDVGAALTSDPRIAGVAFTGSVDVAQAINRTLAARKGPIATLIAETGGQNAMIVDSSALPEQVVKDAISSAFNAAGQRCSAARILCLQEDIADKVVHMLKGALRERVVGDPAFLSTDIGPVIDEDARLRLVAHAEAISRSGRIIESLPLPDACAHGTFVSPLAVEIERISQLESEHFGPILHVLRYPGRKLEALVEDLNATGYGLTLGIHSRIETTWRRVAALAKVGNLYVNRNQIGAVVGVQPFGGEGLSGTGPKAGGPHYLLRFTTERTLSINTAAVGGNARLLAGTG